MTRAAAPVVAFTGAAALRLLAGAVLLTALGALPVHAHPGTPPTPDTLWRAWTWDPWALAGIALSAALYARGVRALWRRAGVGRGIRRWQAGCFAAGIIALFVALISPLAAWGAALFSAHMAQHMVLIAVAAPLIVLGRPLVATLWALPQRTRRLLGRWTRTGPLRAGWKGMSDPLAVWLVHAVAVWVWHAPSLYQATLGSEWIHVVQHLSFFLTALLFWWTLIHVGSSRRYGFGFGVLFVFTTAVHSSLLGALLTFSPTPWYPVYEISVWSWGLTLLEDQQLGGLIMWVPGGVVYLAAALLLLAAWLRLAERQVARSEARLRTPARGREVYDAR